MVNRMVRGLGKIYGLSNMSLGRAHVFAPRHTPFTQPKHGYAKSFESPVVIIDDPDPPDDPGIDDGDILILNECALNKGLIIDTWTHIVGYTPSCASGRPAPQTEISDPNDWPAWVENDYDGNDVNVRSLLTFNLTTDCPLDPPIIYIEGLFLFGKRDVGYSWAPVNFANSTGQGTIVFNKCLFETDFGVSPAFWTPGSINNVASSGPNIILRDCSILTKGSEFLNCDLSKISLERVARQRWYGGTTYDCEQHNCTNTFATDTSAVELMEDFHPELGTPGSNRYAGTNAILSTSTRGLGGDSRTVCTAMKVTAATNNYNYAYAWWVPGTKASFGPSPYDRSIECQVKIPPGQGITRVRAVFSNVHPPVSTSEFNRYSTDADWVENEWMHMPVPTNAEDGVLFTPTAAYARFYFYFYVDEGQPIAGKYVLWDSFGQYAFATRTVTDTMAFDSFGAIYLDDENFETAGFRVGLTVTVTAPGAANDGAVMEILAVNGAGAFIIVSPAPVDEEVLDCTLTAIDPIGHRHGEYYWTDERLTEANGGVMPVS